MAELFTQEDVEHVLSSCREKAIPYGIRFGELTWLSNSRLALEASEFARDKGRSHQMDNAIFMAYFTHGQDIGDISLLLEIARGNELNSDELRAALENGLYSKRVSSGSDMARRLGVRAVPSFFIQDLPAITGVVDEDVFRKTLQGLAMKG